MVELVAGISECDGTVRSKKTTSTTVTFVHAGQKRLGRLAANPTVMRRLNRQKEEHSHLEF